MALGKRWDYKIEHLYNVRDLDVTINKFALDGWRLKQVVIMGSLQTPDEGEFDEVSVLSVIFEKEREF